MPALNKRPLVLQLLPSLCFPKTLPDIMYIGMSTCCLQTYMLFYKDKHRIGFRLLAASTVDAAKPANAGAERHPLGMS